MLQPALAERHERMAGPLSTTRQPSRRLCAGHRCPDSEQDRERQPDGPEESRERAWCAHRDPAKAKPEAGPRSLPKPLLDRATDAILRSHGVPRGFSHRDQNR